MRVCVFVAVVFVLFSFVLCQAPGKKPDLELSHWSQPKAVSVVVSVYPFGQHQPQDAYNTDYMQSPRCLPKQKELGHTVEAKK